MTPPIRKGGVYWVSDGSLRLPPEDKREIKPKRPIIVVSGDGTNGDDNWPTALVIPISTSTTSKTEFCLLLGASVANLPRKGWARVVAVQPLAKTDIQDFMGMLPAQMVTLLEENLFTYMGSS
ncbi:type II toxin-antitoxin system PemK/MazF family toxin [Streptosporangium sp. NPDC050855]|uniref:type II toxin-antitoxin system PemK/MazF family toxin n=1 Tax=Streptosporangium sp. NPDC050855 TaxID=3366194 RepID=UPI00379CAB14